MQYICAIEFILKKLIICITLFYACILNAQDPFYINYSINDGLPSSNVYSIYRENNGTLWFTTDVGIVQFDSRKFQLFNTDNGLSDNEVFRMFKDHKGRIWLHTLNGNPCYIFNNKIYNEHNSDLLKKVKGYGLTMNIFESSDKDLYITYRNGEIAIIDESDNVKKLNIGNNSLSGVWQYKGRMFGIYSEGVIDLESRKNSKLLADKIIYRVFNTENKTYIAKRNILYQPNDSNITPVLELDPKIDINYMVAEGNKWWLCTKSGLILIENGKISRQMFKDCIVSDILKDHEGNYWISTLNKGLLFVSNFGVIQHLKDEKINCIGKRSENELWFGDFNNNYFERKNGHLQKHLFEDPKKAERVTNIRFFKDLSLIISKSGTLLIGPKKTTFYEANANDVLIDGDTVYYASTSFFKLSKASVLNRRYDEISSNILIGKRTLVLCKDNRNKIYLGTNLGLYTYESNGKVSNVGENNADVQTTIEDLYFDEKSELVYVATASKGVIVLRQGKTTLKINTKNGLNNNTALSIKKISDAQFLISSNNGLNLIEFKDKHVTVDNLNALLGLKNKRIKDIELSLDTVYLATENGIISFDIDLFKSKHPTPICIIKDIRSSIGQLIGNKIAHKDKDILISFTGISYIDRGEVTYCYKLNEDPQWTYTNESRINYKSLPAGKYTLKVYCVNSFKVKSNVASISFEILPPYWQKWWFILLVVCMVLSISIWIIRHRFNKQKLRLEQEKLVIQTQRDKARLEKQMIELEQKALRMQMNPHFIFNALNTIKGYYTEGNYLQASNYISKFSKLLRKLLENEEQITTLDNEIEMLRLYIELTQLRYEGIFDYNISVSDELYPEEVLIPNLLLQPLVENAIIHGLAPKSTKGNLDIRFTKETDNLICEVDDNGIGRAASGLNRLNKDHKSKAIDITTERIKLFDKDAHFEIMDKTKGAESYGTLVRIKLAIKKKW